MTYDEALATAMQMARLKGASQVIAEFKDGFVVGPARAWTPEPSQFVIRAKVSDSDLKVTFLGGWQPPVKSVD